jgi:hypothetical protein
LPAVYDLRAKQDIGLKTLCIFWPLGWIGADLSGKMQVLASGGFTMALLRPTLLRPKII